jgi:hypothetical protein
MSILNSVLVLSFVKWTGKEDTLHAYLTILRDKKYNPFTEHIFIYAYVRKL